MDTSKSNHQKAAEEKEPLLPKKPFRTHGGVHIEHMKNTAEFESEEIPTPKKVIISMQQHIGAACEPIVKKGDKVTVGQLIADSTSFMCAPIHSGVSGEVTNLRRRAL